MIILLFRIHTLCKPSEGKQSLLMQKHTSTTHHSQKDTRIPEQENNSETSLYKVAANPREFVQVLHFLSIIIVSNNNNKVNILICWESWWYFSTRRDLMLGAFLFRSPVFLLLFLLICILFVWNGSLAFFLTWVSQYFVISSSRFYPCFCGNSIFIPFLFLFFFCSFVFVVLFSLSRILRRLTHEISKQNVCWK